MSLQVHNNHHVTLLKFIIIITITIMHHCCLGRLGHQSSQPAHLHHLPYVLTPQTDSVWEWCPFLHIPHSCWILLKTYCRIKMVELGGVQSWCSGTVPEHGTLGTLTWSHSFFHIPTLRIRAGCQCPRPTRSWPSSRELMGTGSTSFLSLRFNVLFCILFYTLFPMTSDRAKLSKYGRNWANTYTVI